ncbi:MAG: nucleolar protein 56 [Candidatus Methanocomedens sp.]|nr:MAG: nucleolar protein 56 [ANME-2 cluster archaeon]
MQFVRTWFGIFSVDDGKINSCDLYQKDVKSLAGRLQEIPEVLECNEVCGIDIRSLAKDWGFIASENEYDELFREVNIEYAMMQVTASGSDEHILIQFIDALDDLDKNTNALSERLKELYDLHFPELRLKGEPLARFISRHGVRNNISNWNIEDEKILERARNSSGMELPEPWGTSVTELAASIAGLYDNKNRISQDIEEYMNNHLPNLSAVAGAHIGARLLGIVGSSKKLASMPSSTIQVLGAEKALFKHLRGNATSPKHGVIFQHPLVKESPWWLRGKISRALAAKISIAVRIDYYSGTFDEDIAKDLYRKVDELHKKYPKPRRKKK